MIVKEMWKEFVNDALEKDIYGSYTNDYAYVVAILSFTILFTPIFIIADLIFFPAELIVYKLRKKHGNRR